MSHPQIRDYVDGSDLETLMKNPSLSPALRSPEERIKIAVGISKVGVRNFTFKLPRGSVGEWESGHSLLLRLLGSELSSQLEESNCPWGF